MDTSSPLADSAPHTVDSAHSAPQAVDPVHSALQTVGSPRSSSPRGVPIIPGPLDATRPRETSTSTYRSAPSDASRGGETWMDFLRGHDEPSTPHDESSAILTAESAQQADATRLADRKRRLNVSEPSGRRGGYRSSSSQGTPALGSSSSHAIDLTGSSPERPAPPSRTSLSQDGRGRRRESDIMIPTWQPDSDVSNCPVCGTQFSFWYRKHHCRKCGRVVCAGCSPHRITIPRQYIVRAPEEIKMLQQGGNLIDLTADSGTDQPSASQACNPALGGGEEVRVCNPCVPDPNFSPPPQGLPSRFPDFFSTGFNDSSTPLPYTPLSPGARSRNFTLDSQGSSRLGSGMSGHRPSLSDISSRLPRSDDSSSRSRGVGFGQPNSSSSSYDARTGRPPYSYPHHPSSLSFFQHMRGGGTTGASSNSARYRPFPTSTSAQQAQPSLPPPPPARRIVPEEDECPICHEELPPKGPDGSTTDREAHVEDCIAANFAGRPATSTANLGTGTPGSTTSAHASPAGTPPVGGPGVVAESSRGRRRATHGMLRYRASEKDCIDERGEPQECIICFEEFAVGDEMGRLECFCKFHRACIRSWWDTKGDGSCPTHQGSVTLG